MGLFVILIIFRSLRYAIVTSADPCMHSSIASQCPCKTQRSDILLVLIIYMKYFSILIGWEQCSLKEMQCQKIKYSAIFEILTNFAIEKFCFISIVLTNVFSLWKYWQSKLFCTWRKRMTQFCITLISNNMVCRAIWKHTHSWVFQRTRHSNSCYFGSLWKTHLCVFFPNCTRNYYHTMLLSNSKPCYYACTSSVKYLFYYLLYLVYYVNTSTTKLQLNCMQ